MTGSGDGSAGKTSGLFRFLFVDTTFAGVLGILLILGGFFAYTSMVKEAQPDLAIPTATVTSSWPGASPSLIEKEVTTPLEKAIKSLNHLKSLSSGSRRGTSTLIVEFQADAPVDESIRSLRTKVAEAAGALPPEATTPTVEQMSTTDVPILTYMLHGNASDAVIGEVARDLKERLERVRSIRKVELAGAREEVGRVLVEPLRMNSVGIGMSDIRDAIAAGSLDRPMGEIRDGPVSATIGLSGRFGDLAAIEALPIRKLESGHTIRLRDIAAVRRDLSTESDRTFVSFNGKPFGKGVSITLFKIPGTDTLDAVQQVRATVDRFEMPPGLEASVLTDQSIEVSDKLNGVMINAAQAVVAVMLVLLVMLSWREAIIAGLAVPVTFLGTVAIAFAMDLTMNELVVIGMVLALGLLVDVFILVMEGMHQGIYAERRDFPSSVAVTVKRFALPAFAGQLTTILALAPLLFLPGVSGKFIRLIPLTAIVCLVLSYVVAFVWALPMSRLLLDRPVKGDGKTRVDAISEGIAKRLYGWIVRRVVCSRWVAGGWILAATVVIVFAFMSASRLGFTMYPPMDGRNMGITVELPPGTPLETSSEVGLRIGDTLRQKDYLESIITYVGRKSPFASSGTTEKITDAPGPNLIGYSAVFTPLEQRDGRIAYDYVPELRRELSAAIADLPGATLQITAQTGGPAGGDDLQLEIKGDDLAKLRQVADDVSALMASQPGTADVRTNLGPSRTTLVVSPVRETLEFFDLSLTPVADEIALALSETTVAKLKRGGTEDDVPVQLSIAWPSRNGAVGPPRYWSELSLLRATSPAGSRIDLTALFFAQSDSLPQVIVHSDGTRTATILGKAEETTAGRVLQAIWPQIMEIQQANPDLQIGLAGQAVEQQETGSNMLKIFALTFVLMFALLSLLFNSYRLPFIILFSVPCALVGTLGGFLAIGMPLSFPALVGIVSLLGIVVNVAIVMIETIREHLADGRPLQEAAAHGAADRFRPILSTTLTTVAGLILLSMSSPMWQPLCYAIIFGLLAATLFSFVVVPALFLLMTSRPKKENKAT